ncbi:hypothetical protein QQ008_19855 [Fulvivirgaceae bacterium BMA10]|uniref:Uncharacterized protein n=1 Tax=Splendidivirga corallicola TaxID=3051826 RepID=A0ABT8KTZ7_9BACT|nr:hypothetical protein [Fulvivirgaceae bacterium BMA10]
MKLTKIFICSICVLILACQEEPYDIPHGVPSVVKIYNNYAYTTNGEFGLDIIDLNTLKTVNKMPPAREMNSIDNLSITDNLLFAIDARGEDFLAVFSLDNPTSPKLVSGPVPVQGAPFTGVSAANGNVVVSGGTTFMNFRKYDANGKLSDTEGRFGRDRGHPDILLSEDGRVAYASTDFNGQVNGARFGMIALELDGLTNSPRLISEIGIPGAGFTAGTTRPAGFPIQSALADDHLLVAYGEGLAIIELVNGRGLASLNTLDLGLAAISISVFNGVAYVIGNEPTPTLVKIDISDIENPVIIESISLNTNGGIPTSIDVNNQYILIAANEGGLIVMNN